MKAYQLSKSKNTYWWTGTIDTETLPTEDEKYKYVSDINLAKELSGKQIK